MENNKKIFHHLKYFLNSVLIACFLSSCAWYERKNEEDYYSSAAPFIVGEIVKSQNATRSVTVIRKRGLAHKFIVSLSTCLKDSIKKDIPIQNALFHIEYQKQGKSKKKEILKVTTDTNGCVSWDEEYPYRYIIKPTWIVLDRSIKSPSGPYAGEEKISLAINPWLSSEDNEFPPVLDLREIYSAHHNIFKQHPYQKEGLNFLQKAQQEQHPQLWIDHIDVQIEQKSQTKPLIDSKKQDVNALLKDYRTLCNKEKQIEGHCYHREFKINLTVPLQIRMYSLGGDLIDSDIAGGEYEVQVQMLASPHVNQKKYRIHESKCLKNVKISENQKNAEVGTKFISLACDISVSYFNPNATHALAVEIKPSTSSNLPFKKFEGLYTLSLDHINSSTVQKYTINSDLDQKYSNLYKNHSIFSHEKIPSVYESIKDKKSHHHDLGFRPVFMDITPGDVKFSDIVNDENCSDNENVVKRKVRFIGNACLKDPITSKPYNKTKFQVFIEDVNTGEMKEVFVADNNSSQRITDKILTTTDQGCIPWVDILEHDFYDVQTYTNRRVHFISTSLNLYGSLLYSVNPWQRAFQASQDTNQLGLNAARNSKLGVPKPKLVINQFKSINLFPSYVLDNFLNLHVFQNLYFLFQPFITRPDDVSLGLDHKARGLIRDGYYIVRVLLARNPQETEDVSRIINKNQFDKKKSQILNNSSFKKAKYLTHIDTILKAEANFVNLYMPLSFTKDQMLYLSSRNLLSIEVVPTDPSYYHFKPVEKQGRTTCELDLKNTKWKPYFNHDLINFPYVGAFNAQNWTNWNVLRQSPSFDTDAIIEESKEGGKYKHFTLSKNSTSDIKTLNGKGLAMISSQENECQGIPLEKDQSGTYFNSKELQKCEPARSSEVALEMTKKLSSQVQKRAKEKVSKNLKYKDSDKNLKGLIKNFANSHSLKTVFLEDPQQKQKWIEDLKTSYKKIKSLNDRVSFSEKQLSLIEDKKLKQNIINALDQCPSVFSGKKAECINQAFKEELTKFFTLMEEEKNNRSFESFISLDSENLAKENTIKNLESFIQNNLYKDVPLNINKDFLTNIINQGVIYEDEHNLKNVKLGQAMCGFWFHSFFNEYLEAEQVQSAYSNFISQYDYYSVLEQDYSVNENSYHEKQNFLKEFLSIVPDADKNLKNCHENYTQCIVRDHCKMREHSSKKQYSYCRGVDNFEDKTCGRLLKTECLKNKNSSLCQQKITDKNCHYSLNEFCKLNSDYSICRKYYGRCLSNYNACSKSKDNKIFSDYKPFDFYKNLNKDNKFIKKEQYKNQPVKKALSILHSLVVCNNPIRPLWCSLKTESVKNRFAMMSSCLKNPFDFFEFHNKMFVEKISDKSPKYIEGLATTFTVSANFSTGSYMNWTSQFGSSISLKTGGSVSPSLPSVFSFTLADLSLSKSVSSNVSNSGRRAIDVRVGEGAFLLASKATIDIEVEKYQKCLVIKPKPHAFFAHIQGGLLKPYNNSKHLWSKNFPAYKKALASRLGLMVCNPKEEKKPQTIRESYYYISQLADANSSSQFLNLYDLSNRPFAAFIRGKKDFYNFFNMSKSIMEGDNGNLSQNAQINRHPYNMFYDYPHPIEEVISLSLTLREFGISGFYPGVYDYGIEGKKLDAPFKNQSHGSFQKFQKWWDGLQPDNITVLPRSPVHKDITVQQ